MIKINYSDLVFSGRGLSALWAILVGLNKKKGRVLLPINICEIVYPIICKSGMVPVFYDVDKFTGNASLETIEAAYTGHEDVLLAVHNFGAPLEIDRITHWAAEHHIFLIEDVCNSLGASFSGKPLGTWGDAAIFSFGYAKIIEYGMGGAALIKDVHLRSKVESIIKSLTPFSKLHENKNIEFQEQLRRLRAGDILPSPSLYVPLYDSYCDYLLYRIGENQQKDILHLLCELESNVASREIKAQRYRNEIISDKIKHINHIDGQIYWRYNIMIEPPYRQKLIENLRLDKLLVSTWYPSILNLFQNHMEPGKFKGINDFESSVINLFVDNRVSQNDISRVVEVINKF
jgi:dTDP-4-amino-4,6-dideoxygalactose transaminase